ncbi:MAG: hypothetical protein RL318_1456 [Fibrobacterota bacterium]|jgi:putative FmdB family regulatory protein
MPIYEYLCRDCNTVYQFFSRTLSVKAPPPCPKDPVHQELERQMSGFAIGAAAASVASQEAGDPTPETFAKMENLMGRLEGIDENDPKAMGHLMREMSAITGEGAHDPAMQEAIRRLEGGEDPEKVEELLEGQWDEESPGPGTHRTGPSLDSSIYDM